MSTLLRAIATAILCLSLHAPAEGQSVNVSPSAEPQNRLALLEGLEGRWSMTAFMTSDGGDSWSQLSQTTVTIQYIHNNMVLKEEVENPASDAFNMLSFITWDQYRSVYRKAAIDDYWGIMDIYSGDIDDNRLVLDNLESGTFFPVESGQWRSFRLSIDLSGDERTMLVEASDDGGANWEPAFRSEYVRIAE